MAKEFFFHSETEELFKLLETISSRSGVSRGKAFEDLLAAIVSALAAETLEDEYFEAIKSHTEGKKGNRAVDLFPVFFAETVNAISDTDNDVLGDLFQGSISYGENGLYLTPQSIASLLSRLTIGDPKTSDGYQLAHSNSERISICDPACGSGLLLIEAAKSNPRAELYGQDIDLRCAQMTAINLGLRGKYGWVVCGNTLSCEKRVCYRIGSFFHESPNGLRRGVLRKVEPEQCPFPYGGVAEKTRKRKRKRRRRQFFE